MIDVKIRPQKDLTLAPTVSGFRSSGISRYHHLVFCLCEPQTQRFVASSETPKSAGSASCCSVVHRAMVVSEAHRVTAAAWCTSAGKLIMGRWEGPARRLTNKAQGLLPRMMPCGLSPSAIRRGEMARGIHMRLTLSHAARLSTRSRRVRDARDYKRGMRFEGSAIIRVRGCGLARRRPCLL
jgi:hypothetical protein